MSLYYRLKRRLGHDTVERWENTAFRYEYTVTHLNGETSTVVAHGFSPNGAFAEFYEYTDVYTLLGQHGPYPTGEKGLRVLEGIQEVERERVARTVLWCDMDRADGTVVDSGLYDEAIDQ